MNPINHRKFSFAKLATALVLGAGLGAGSAHAQITIDVGGDGSIGDLTLVTDAGIAAMPNYGDTWSADGGEEHPSTRGSSARPWRFRPPET